MLKCLSSTNDIVISLAERKRSVIQMSSELNFVFVSYFNFCGSEENIHFLVLNSVEEKKRNKIVATQVEMMSTTMVASVQFECTVHGTSVHFLYFLCRFFLLLHCLVVAILLCTQPNKLAGGTSLLYSCILTCRATAIRMQNGRWTQREQPCWSLLCTPSSNGIAFREWNVRCAVR